MEFSERDLSLVFSALEFSSERHRDQRRKGREAAPYINHPIRVASLLWHAGEVRDIEVLAASLLHDVLEDTSTSPDEIRSRFGDRVLSLVREVTDDKSLPKAERKRLQIEHAPSLSPEAAQVKIADKIANIHDIINTPPHDWPPARLIAYLDWTEKVVAGLRGRNGKLEALYDQVLSEGRERLQRTLQEESDAS